MKAWMFINLLFTSFVLSSCNYPLGKSFGSPEKNIDTLDSAQIDHALVMERVIKPKCFECHSEAQRIRGNVALDTYQQVIENLEDIQADIEDGSMPKDRPPLTSEEKSIILGWIEAGAPEKAASSEVLSDEALMINSMVKFLINNK